MFWKDLAKEMKSRVWVSIATKAVSRRFASRVSRSSVPAGLKARENGGYGAKVKGEKRGVESGTRGEEA